MTYLKIVSKGWEGYNGHLNIITFKNGVSTTPVPQLIADRIAGAVSVVACDAEGNTDENPAAVGIQNRLVSESAARAPIAEPLTRMTDKEKSLEAKLDAARSLTAPVEHLYTRAELEQIADEKGIKGVRVVGDAWQVKGKAIPVLINSILAAQAEFIAQRNAALESAGGPVRKATLSAEETAAAEAEKEVIPDAIGFEGMAEAYQGPEGIVVPAAALIEAALKNSGRSLTGWNKERNHIRKEAIEAELEALALHYGMKFTPVVAEEPKAEAPKSDEPAPVVAPEGAKEGEGDEKRDPEEVKSEGNPADEAGDTSEEQSQEQGSEDGASKEA